MKHRFWKRAAEWLIAHSPQTKIAIVSAVDFVLLSTIALMCVALNAPFTNAVSASGIHPFAAVVPLATIACLALLKVYHTVIRFGGAGQARRIAFGVITGALLVWSLAAMVGVPLIGVERLALHIAASALALIAVRMLAGYVLNASLDSRLPRDRVVIYGAGEGGVQLAAALAIGKRFKAVAFADDRREIQGRVLLGLPVVAPEKLAALKEEHWFDRVLLAVPSVTGSRRRRLLESLASLTVKVMVMPSVEELADGTHRIDELRDVQIEDLLSRDPVQPMAELLESHIKGKNVLVTGAGGSIGSELCRRAILLGARRLVLLDVSEFSLYQIEGALRREAQRANCELVPVLANVLDGSMAQHVLAEQRIETIYHSAAYKHVPLVEQNVLAAVHNNVFGTLAVLEAAHAAGVKNFVLISTDKAVRPTSIMGASKRVCELVAQAFFAEHRGLRISIVRFGNVLASSGSVVPVFQDQIRTGGPVTVTHPDVTRYFMTIPEAAQLVIQAGAMGGAGEVFVLDMGRPVKILDLAIRMIHLSGMEARSESDPGGDIAIEFTGLRPGEKLHEELLIGDDPEPTRHPRILKASEQLPAWAPVSDSLKSLSHAIQLRDASRVRALVLEIAKGGEGVRDGRSDRVVPLRPVTLAGSPSVTDLLVPLKS